MKIEFSGATRNVTGSKHLLHINEKKILLECGLFQGKRKESIIANLNFPFDAKKIDAVVLSHAHIDHSGALPILVKKGFSGPIYCTHATRDLCAIMLRDSAYIQEKDVEWIRKKLKDNEAEPLYTIEDANRTISLFRSVAYKQKFFPVKGAGITFYDAGHILGSAVEEWEIDDEKTKQKIRLGFTGDLGRHNLPILKNPTQLKNLDVLITESTYGDRLHHEIAEVEHHLAKKIKATYEKKGKIIIPAFSVGRTQEILYVLKQLELQKKIPALPIFVDSPLSVNATEIFALHPECYDAKTRELLEAGEDPFSDKNNVRFIQNVEESKALNNFENSAIIISASGMCEAGRIKHHLINHIGNAKNIVLVVGFMAENTLGRRLVEKVDPVKIFGKEYSVKAEVIIYNAFSGHADQKGLLHFAENCGTPKNIFCVHGEESQILVFEKKLKNLPNLKNCKISVPSAGEIFELQKNKKFS